VVADGKRLAAEARAIHEERMASDGAPERAAAAFQQLDPGRKRESQRAPLKWRKERGEDKWNAGAYAIRGPVNGYLEVSHGGVSIGLVAYADGVSLRTNLERAKDRAERHRRGEQ
jgi:hypothetical protein